MRYNRHREARLASARRMDARHPGWTERMLAPAKCARCGDPIVPAIGSDQHCGDCLSRLCEYFADAQQ